MTAAGNTGYESWGDDTRSAITRMRAAGVANTLTADAPNWGQDWSFTMRDGAKEVFAADPDKNTVFSIHMYGVYDAKREVSDYINRFTEAKLPLVVGEFGDRYSDGDPDEDAIMVTTRSLGVGYLGWPRSGNGSGVECLDLVTGFDAGRLTPWGERLFNGPDDIKETAEEAGVFKGTGHGGSGARTTG
ncbi:cellulase family glycosylhydrolase [Streptomyces sp. NPDC050161]|uniref:cellulase family glycosylhydrolase n=1 Tax=Streptomyces sp. NPDC050161 TaxID=3365604 RepID=UPI0037BBBE3F